MNYYEYQIEKPITQPPHEIALINPDYVFKSKVDLILIKSNNPYYDYCITDMNNNTFFRLRNDSRVVTLNDINNNPICSTSFTDIRQLSLGGENKNPVAYVVPKNSTKANKFNIVFNNNATEQKEILSMNYDNNYRTCGLFAGKERESAPLVCRAKRVKENVDDLYIIEIAPGVDHYFMLGLIMVFIYKYEIVKRKQQKIELEKEKEKEKSRQALKARRRKRLLGIRNW
ncbi:hypothetical protein PIROE2DRAFT_12645 [Piromyces sp. E2]|nr:hypothetical protein PIROE2DRAFT_12645 [Piromyces sp. E2]|eukprot:OUM61352.1 hypothetical protein PIROE2DRAFT_12645 [Piromyces sp. E2]